jgi:hypothetical protein
MLTTHCFTDPVRDEQLSVGFKVSKSKLKAAVNWRSAQHVTLYNIPFSHVIIGFQHK